jgi:hypothetical protein
MQAVGQTLTYDDGRVCPAQRRWWIGRRWR